MGIMARILAALFKSNSVQHRKKQFQTEKLAFSRALESFLQIDLDPEVTLFCDISLDTPVKTVLNEISQVFWWRNEITFS